MNYTDRRDVHVLSDACRTASGTLRASLSGTFLQTLPDLVTPLKGYSLNPRNCPAKGSGTVEAT